MAVALFVAILVVANGFVAHAQPFRLTRLGHDFLPFYVAGSLLREGRPQDMYDLDVIRAREQQVAAANGLPGGAGFGPFWNPPFYAMPFVGMSTLSYETALVAWLGINLAALAIATTLLCRLVASAPLLPCATRHSAPHPSPLARVRGRGSGTNWRTWGLVPLLLLASTPFFLAFTHGQNTFISLLLLTLAVLAWRSRRGFLTGLVLGLLTYKPQLAALVALIAFIDLGWRVALGACLSGGLLLIASMVAMPGIVETYLAAMPRMLRYMQVEHPYMWERHGTLRAFWRLLLQGRAAGEATAATNVLTLGSAGMLLAGLLWAAVRCRVSATDARTRDRVIAATVAAMPLIMPFYFDYDLLLLAIPAALYAVERLNRPAGEPLAMRGADRWVVPAWCGLYLWLIVNPDVAERTRVNGAVLLLAVLAGALLARALRRDAETAQCTLDEPAAAAPLAAAA